MFLLETADKGKANETEAMMKQVGQQAYQLLNGEVTHSARRIFDLNQLANSSSGDGNWGGQRRGLHSPERDEVTDIAKMLVKLRDKATEYRGLANKLGGNAQRWDAAIVEITDTLAGIESLANDL